jgi:hypothetical protein
VPDYKCNRDKVRCPWRKDRTDGRPLPSVLLGGALSSSFMGQLWRHIQNLSGALVVVGGVQ